MKKTVALLLALLLLAFAPMAAFAQKEGDGEQEDSIAISKLELFKWDTAIVNARMTPTGKVAECGFYYTPEGGKTKVAKGKYIEKESRQYKYLKLEKGKKYSIQAYYKLKSGEEFTSQARTITAKKKESYSEKLPTGSANQRYQYLLNVEKKYFNWDARPTGYKTLAQAKKNMTTIQVPVWKRNARTGKKTASKMSLTVNKKLAKNVQKIFKEIYALDIKFPIKTLKGFGYRRVGGALLTGFSKRISIHAFGAAIDINPIENDYFVGKNSDGRDKKNPYYIPKEVIRIFEKNGWFWGGNFSICSDTMHFQYLDLGFLSYTTSPFTEYKYTKGKKPVANDRVRDIQRRLQYLKLYQTELDGKYGPGTEAAVKKFQKKYKLKVNGRMTKQTWIKLYNATHVI